MRVFRWIDYFLLSAIFLYLFLIVSTLPVIFDEGYNLQVPVMLLKENKYDTIYHARSFDGFTTITTGPTVLVPIFLIFKIFGIGLLRARIVQYLYSIALIGLLWFQFVKYFNRVVGVVLLLILYSMPSYLYLSLSVLGELPAIFYIFLGITIWDGASGRYQKISIVLMGISVITKLYFGMVLIPLLAFVVMRSIQTKNPFKNIIKEMFLVAFLFSLPFILWEIIKFSYLGYAQYLNYLAEMISFAATQQINVESLSILPSSIIDILNRFVVFSTGIFPGLPVWIVWAIVGGIVLVNIQKILRGLDNENIVFSLSFLIFITYLLWFMFISSLGWWRHIYPFSILFLFLLGDLIKYMFKFLKQNAIKYALVVVLCLSFVLYVMPFVFDQHKETQMFSETLNFQRQFANEVNVYRQAGYQIGVDGWWQAPEISFLAGGVKFLQFDCTQDHQEKHVVIYSSLEDSVPVQANALKECLGQKVFESPDSVFSLYLPANK